MEIEKGYRLILQEEIHGKKYWLVYKRYYSQWYTNEEGRCVRDYTDVLDCVFENREDAQRYREVFNIHFNRYF